MKYRDIPLHYRLSIEDKYGFKYGFHKTEQISRSGAFFLPERKKITVAVSLFC